MSMHHGFDFIELPVLDMAATKAFYAAVFGWSFQDWGDEYADIKDAGVSGGLRKVDVAPLNGGALPIIYSNDLDASEKRVREAGGTIVERHEFPGGRRFHFADPSGLILAVWTKA